MFHGLYQWIILLPWHFDLLPNFSSLEGCLEKKGEEGGLFGLVCVCLGGCVWFQLVLALSARLG